MFQRSFAQTEQFGKLALRQGDLFPDRSNIDVCRDMYRAAIFFSLGESECLSGTLDHPLSRGWFLLVHLDSLADLYVLTISARTIFKRRRSFGAKSVFWFLAKMLSKKTGISVPVKNVMTR